MNPVNALPPGTILRSGMGEYKIVSVLGQGGFGITYLVTGEIMHGNVPTEAPFAIKEYFPSTFAERVGDEVKAKPDKITEYEKGKADFISEAKKLHSLGAENINIVKVNEVFEANGTAYYVMQYINGQSLTAYVKERKKLTYREALAILGPIIDAVGFLHKSRINHLDIKPDNIMIHDGTKGMVPVLIDFGLSVHFKKNGEKTTPKGVHGVSEGYSPMEQYAGIKEFIPAADIYSLAATLLYALTGETPKSAAELKVQEVRTQLAKIVPEENLAGICKALNRSFDDRTDSIELFKSDLGLSQGGTVTEVINIEEEERKRRKNIIVIVAVAVVIIGAVIWMLTLPGKQKGEAPQPTPLTDTIIKDTTSVVSTTSAASVVAPEEPSATTSSEKEPATSSVEEAKPAKPTSSESATTPQKDPTPQKEEKKPEPKPEKPAVTTGSLSLGYGTWTGGIKNGKPDGRGKIVFHSSHRVDRSTSVEANAGDYFVATYENGSLISGKLYDSSGNLIKTIIP